MPTIGFQTSCYEKSFDLLLNKGLFQHYLELFPKTNFTEKFIVINNVEQRDKVENIVKNIPDIKYYFAYDEIDKVLPHFEVSVFDLLPGIYYSVQHFVGMYYTNCDYLFHVSEDCNIDNLNSEFLTDCINILESNDDYLLAQPRWGIDPEKGAKEEEIRTDNNFYIAKGFSDQLYIAKTKIFKENIYNYEHPDSNRYPTKGGNAFERRVNSYMWCNDKYRAIHKDYHYLYGFYDSLIKGE